MTRKDGNYGPVPAKGLSPRNCVTCGESFQPYRAIQLTCSRPCRDATPEAREKSRALDHARPAEEKIRRAANRSVSKSDNPEKARQWNLASNLRKYDMSIEEYQQMLDNQNGLCLICGNAPDPNGIKSASRLHVDHDHATGKVRGLLCNKCNPGIGYFQNSPELLEAAAAYLRRHNAN